MRIGSRVIDIKIPGTLFAVVVLVFALLLNVDDVLSIILGLLIECIVLLIDFGETIKRNNEEVVQAIKLTEKINLTTEFSNTLNQLVRNLNGITQDGYDFFVKQTSEKMAGFLDEIVDINNGKMELFDPDQINDGGIWLLERREVNIPTLFATSIIDNENNIWITRKGVDYHKKNIEAASDGRKITRVFILRNDAMLSNRQFQKTMIEQSAAKIEVMYVLARDLPKEDILDFGIWDEKMVCYLEDRHATYLTTQADLNKANRLKNVILNSSKTFSAKTEQEFDQIKKSISRDFLTVSAPLAANYAQKFCAGRKSHIDPVSCRWYHESWQYLRLADLVVTPRLNNNFFIDYIGKSLLSSQSPKILVCGLADYEMLAVLIEAIEDTHIIDFEITVIDICETPVKLASWYAERRNIKITALAVDAKATGFPDESFDLIITDYFLTKLKPEDANAVIVEWRRILKQKGQVITTIHLSKNGSNGSSSEENIQTFIEKAVARLPENSGIGKNKMKKLAETYARKNKSFPLNSVEGLNDLFDGFRVDIVNTFRSDVEVADSQNAQVVAIKQ